MNVVVIGVGNMGRHHARVYSELPGVSLIAVSDCDKKVGQIIADKYGCRYYSDYIELLNKEKIDAASIATPTFLHKKIAVECLNRKIPIIIEKPIAETINNAYEIIETANKNNTLVCVGHIERYNPAIQELKKMVEAHKIGDIVSIETKRVGLFPSRIKEDDVIIDLAVHDIDICNFLSCSKPKFVYAEGGKALNSKRIDYATIFLKYEKFNATLQVNWITPVKVRGLIITGTKSYVEVNYLNQSIKIYKSNYEKTFDSFGDYLVKFGTPHISVTSLNAQEPLRNELLNFLNAVSGKNAETVTAEDGLLALKVCLYARECCKDSHKMEVL